MNHPQQVMPDLNFSDFFKGKLLFGCLFPALSIICRQVWHILDEYFIRSDGMTEIALSLADWRKANCKEHRFPLLCFSLILLCCVLFCSLCSLNQRCVAPFPDNSEEKIDGNSLSWLQYVMCVYLSSLCMLQDTAALRCYCRSLPPVFWVSSCKHVKYGTCIIDPFVLLRIPTYSWSRC